MQSWQKTEERERKWQARFARPGTLGEAMKLASSEMPAATDGHTSQPKRISECAHGGFRSIRTSAPDSEEVKLEEQWADGRGKDDLLVPRW